MVVWQLNGGRNAALQLRRVAGFSRTRKTIEDIAAEL